MESCPDSILPPGAKGVVGPEMESCPDFILPPGAKGVVN